MVPLTITATDALVCCLRCLALVLGWKPCSSTTASTFRRVSSDTSGWWFSTRDTVATPTPDSFAISLMVIGIPPVRVLAFPLEGGKRRGEAVTDEGAARGGAW